MEEDKTYILCKFINEDLDDNDRPIQVGYANWLIFDGPNIPISSLIQEEKEITVKWPKNYDVQPKEAMAKILADVTWIHTVAIVKAQSNDWAKIVEASKNIIKYGMLFPSKEQRKELVKRKDLNTSYNTKKFPKSLKDKKNMTRNERDDKYPVTIKTVSEKDSKLKDEYFVNKSLPKKRAIDMTDETDVKIKRGKKKEKKQINIEKIETYDEDKLHLNFHQMEIESETSEIENLKQASSCSTSVVSLPSLKEKKSVNDSIIKVEGSLSQGSSLHTARTIYDPTQIMISFGSKILPLATVQKARHSKLSILATELCSLVFTNKELALCSLKGKKSNAHSTFQKQIIDEEKVKGIIEYIAKYFSKHPDEIKDEVYRAIGNKLNNFSKTSEGKQIINEFLAERFAQQQQIEANEQQIAAIKQGADPQLVTTQSDTIHQQEVLQHEQQQLTAKQNIEIISSSKEADNTFLLREITTLQHQANNPEQQQLLEKIINLVKR